MNVRCILNVVSITSLKANVDLGNLNVYEIEKKKNRNFIRVNFTLSCTYNKV